MITAGSNSRLSDFEACPFKAKLKYIDKIPEPVKPVTPGKEDPMERGSRIHNFAERFVKGEEKELIPELKSFAPEFATAQNFFNKQSAVGEENWNYDENWQPLGDPFAGSTPDWNLFQKVKFRIKTDLTVFLSKVKAVIVDYKTGKKFGNEVKHAEQLELYAVGGFLRYPQLKEIITELWYSDINDITTMIFSRNDGLKRLKAWDDRNKRMLTATEFPPNPSAFTCKWCPYRQDRTGHCQVGVF